ncbi:hypothetical protein [Rhizobium straminoryzae]|uniref:Uncharacterized protein n=1 Tax=Rhizobium straminoryzae TaxID=1387186 RepID=A0A549T123_9HYPH|nr:hypothetical protein [Rhizobium straminoryzae]TRL35518.1 hypothetical protein FNA46_20175 [Rhizobium straminoryzae]
MKLLALLGASCAVGIAPAVAGPRENALNHIAQVVAINQLCPSLEPQTGPIALMATRFGIDFKRDETELRTQVLNQMAPWTGQPTESACIAGLMLYGPNGANVPGLLKQK